MAEKIQILVAGLPGKMATMIVQRLAQSPEYEIIPYSFTGPEINDDDVEISFKGPFGVEKSMRIKLVAPFEREKWIHKITSMYPSMLVVDFTQPDATEPNCEFYCKNKLPFVMGTTGGDPNALATMVNESNISAVIAPNMSVPITAIMAMIENAAETFPNALAGFNLQIVESHQSPKKDKSGTGKAIGENLKSLGADYKGEEDIIAIRDPKQQLFMGIPHEALSGHGWHSYSLISPDGSVSLRIEHNINGRQTYVEGTLKAINFLAKKIQAGSFGECFSMIHVMKG
jgi:4-hydroxy-tetrahydrodipicolinate reductase